MSDQVGKSSSSQSAFASGCASAAMVTGTLAGGAAGTAWEDALMTGVGDASAKPEFPACAVARCNCSIKPGAPPSPGGGESGVPPVTGTNPAPTTVEANTATENALAPPKPGTRHFSRIDAPKAVSVLTATAIVNPLTADSYRISLLLGCAFNNSRIYFLPFILDTDLHQCTANLWIT